MMRNTVRLVVLALACALPAGRPPLAAGSGSGAAMAAGSAEAVKEGAAPAAALTLAQAASDAGPPPPRAIREAQALLAELGYAPGPADGIWGRRTGQAYRAFLRDAGLPAAERLTPEALRAIRAMAKRAGVTPDRATTGAPEAPREPAAEAFPPDVLHRAAQSGDIDGLQEALAAGAEVDARDGRGWTALMHAVNKGYPLLVEPLLAAGADPDMRAPDGATALFMAVVFGHTEVIEQLMEAGADLSVRGPKGKTAVEVARTRYGEAEAAKSNGEPPAVLALLQGMSLDDARAEAEVRFLPGKRFRDCEECPEMVVVPSGSFGMGSPSGEAERNADEGPVHRVTIARPFAVGVYEVTFGEWEACVSGGGCGGYLPDDEGWGRGRRPVISMSWEDAKGYVRWLSRETGEGYRLLSESEWEYVARGGTRGPFHTGSTISTAQANYDGNFTYGSGREGVYREETVRVGSFPANGFGLHDVHGNVWEWVEDCWNGSYEGAPVDGSAWESGNCGARVLRGGSWYDKPRHLRSAYRLWNTTGNRDSNNGFRVARTLD